MSDKQALIPIMNGQYERIEQIETPWGIRFAEGDMRPRIEYFHDAVRALTSGEDPYAKHSRLSVEHLAYDLSQLRQIPGNPLGKIYGAVEASSGTAVAKLGEAWGSGIARPDRATRRELAELYKDYTVLFAAVFAEVADMNFQSRQDDIDTAIEDIAKVEEVIQALANGQMSLTEAQNQLDQVELDALRQQMLAAISKGKLKASQAQEALTQLQEIENKIKTEGQTIDTAHMHYVTGQLAVYEEGKETVKRLASQGMNLAGKFVENAMAQAAGRGAGRNI